MLLTTVAGVAAAARYQEQQAGGVAASVDCAGLAVKVADFGFSKLTSRWRPGRGAAPSPLSSSGAGMWRGNDGNCCTPQTRNVGTVGYMAPEVLAHADGSTVPPRGGGGAEEAAAAAGGYDAAAADMWAVGVILYMMLTARPPFPDSPGAPPAAGGGAGADGMLLQKLAGYERLRRADYLPLPPPLQVALGLGSIVALYYRSSVSYQIH